ncbi:MAG: hypothetical protein QOK40_2226 [Miltoncostaeaceae bacterium]|nr:hypothetical protein [Miltoncostaeaceae bacterium]
MPSPQELAAKESPVRRATWQGGLVVLGICAGTVAWAAVGSQTDAACGCADYGWVAAAGNADAAFIASAGTITRADAQGGLLRRAHAIAYSARSGSPLVWLSAGEERLWAGQRGSARAFRASDLAPLGPPLRLFRGGQGPNIASAAGAVWGIELNGGVVRGADPRRPARVWSVGVGRGTADIASDGRTVYVALHRRWAGHQIARSTRSALVAIDARTHRIVWRRAVGFDPDAIAAGASGVWATGGREGQLVELGRRDGRVLMRVQIGRGATDVAAAADGAVVLTDRGLFGVSSGVGVRWLAGAGRQDQAVVLGGRRLWIADARQGALKPARPV